MKTIVKTTLLRVVVYAALFGYALPKAFGLFASGAFVFHGGALAALAASAVYMLAMCVAVFVYAAVIDRFRKRLEERKLFDKLSAAFCFVASTAFIVVVSAAWPALGLRVSGLLSAVLAGLVCLGAMSATLYATSPCYRGRCKDCSGNCDKSKCKGKCGGNCGGQRRNDNSGQVQAQAPKCSGNCPGGCGGAKTN